MSTSAARPKRRADAQQSIDRILAAAREQFATNPRASIEDIATAAGVGRMTLYGHFRTRADLIEATLADALGSGDAVLEEVDLTGEPRAVMRELLLSSWSLVWRSSALLAAAEGTLGDERIRELHEAPAQRLEGLIRRGQETGAFRTDLPVLWLVNAVHYLLHGAATEVRVGRLPAEDAAYVVSESVDALLAPKTGK